MTKKMILLVLLVLASTSKLLPYIVTTDVLKHPITNKTVVLYGDAHSELRGIGVRESKHQYQLMLNKIISSTKNPANKTRFLIEGLKEIEEGDRFLLRFGLISNVLVYLSALQLYKDSPVFINSDVAQLISEKITNINTRSWQNLNTDEAMLAGFNDSVAKLRHRLISCELKNVLPDFVTRYTLWIDFLEFRMHKILPIFKFASDYRENIRKYHGGLACALFNEQDINTILEIENDHNSTRFIVFAGAAHTKSIAFALEFEGYKRVYTSNVNNFNNFPCIAELPSCGINLSKDIDDYIRNLENNLLPMQMQTLSRFFQNVASLQAIPLEYWSSVHDCDFDWIDKGEVKMNSPIKSFFYHNQRTIKILSTLALVGLGSYFLLKNVNWLKNIST